jgi:iron complex outermembrane recepter protein
MPLSGAKARNILTSACLVPVVLLGSEASFGAEDATAASPAVMLEEVIVTATKRAESVQDVPATVSVEKGDQLVEQGFTSLADYAEKVPGLNVVNSGTPGQNAVSIRGISSNTSTSAVGTYLDDTPIGSSSGWARGSATLLDMLPYDVERIEVLHGPQGTLYGEGSMGGLIKYVLKTASTTEFEGNLGADLLTIDGAGKSGYALRARVNLPLISDVLGVSLSAFNQVTPGYVTNVYPGASARDTNETRQYGERVAVLWQPASNLSVKLTALEQVIEADDAGLRQFSSVAPVPNAPGAVIVSPTNPLPDLTESVAFPSRYDQHLYYTATTVDWNPGPVDFVSATSWSRQNSYTQFDLTPFFGSLLPYAGGTAAGLVQAADPFGLDKFTQELRALSPTGGTIEWLGGLFYTNERSKNAFYYNVLTSAYQPDPAFPSPGGLFNSTYPGSFHEYAAYGNLTWNVTQALSFTGGARYARNGQNVQFTTLTGPFYPTPSPNYVPIGSSDNVTTWMADAKYRFTPDVMAYFRVATGYRPGGPNSPLPGIPLTVGSDSLTNYELGIKSTLLERRVQLNFDVYHIDWKNIQLTAVSPADLSFLANGGKAVSNGVEFESEYTPFRGLTLGLNGAYTDAHLTSLAPETSYLLTGYQLPNVPKANVAASVEYEWPLSGPWTAHVGGNYQYVSQQWLSQVEAPSAATIAAIQAPGYSLYNLNASAGTDHLTFRAYVRNLTNSRALVSNGITGHTVETDAVTGASQVLAGFLQPRTVGVGVDYKF